MFDFERSYVERVARTRSLWFIFNLIWGNICGVTFFILASAYLFVHKAPDWRLSCAVALVAAPIGLRCAYLGYLARRRYLEIKPAESPGAQSLGVMSWERVHAIVYVAVFAIVVAKFLHLF